MSPWAVPNVVPNRSSSLGSSIVHEPSAKTIVVIAVVAALTLAIAGTAYAANAGDGQSNQASDAQAFRGGADQSTDTMGTDRVGPVQQRDREQDTTGEDCDGVCDGTCDGDCDQAQEHLD